MINKFSRHLGQKDRGDHRSRTRPHSLQMCSTSPRTVILSIPREDLLGCQFLLTRSIGPGPSSHIVGTQGKIGPHSFNLNSYLKLFFCLLITIINNNLSLKICYKNIMSITFFYFIFVDAYLGYLQLTTKSKSSCN